MYPMDQVRRRSDLVYYANRTDMYGCFFNPLNPFATVYVPRCSGGPAMTWAMHVVAWLELGEMDEAAKIWDLAYANARAPFGVWTENAFNGDLGAVNFITGVGGFLQALLNGYGGGNFISRADSTPVLQSRANRRPRHPTYLHEHAVRPPAATEDRLCQFWQGTFPSDRLLSFHLRDHL